MSDVLHRPPPEVGRDPGPRRLGGPLPPPARVPGPVPIPPEPEPVEVVDREKTCPLLLRVFPKLGGHHRLEEYARRGQEPKEEVQMYTWMDATLRELADLVKEIQPDAKQKNARLAFALVYPDRRGKNVMRQVGIVHNRLPGPDDNKTLKSLNFQTGDFLDVAIYI